MSNGCQMELCVHVIPSYLSVSTCTIIGQFSGHSFTARLTKLKSLFKLKFFPFHLSPEIKNSFNNLVFSVHNVSYSASFLRVRSIDLSGKN